MAQATFFEHQLPSMPADTAALTEALFLRDGATDPMGEGRV
jgi:hypothetical protein